MNAGAREPSRRPGRRWWLVAVLVAAWQLMSVLGLSNERLLPAPVAIFEAFVSLTAAGSLPRDALASVARVLSGFALAAALGTGLGATLALSPALALPARTVVEILRPIPPIAWIPLAVLWFGLGTPSAVFIVSVGAFFPVFINTFEGVSKVPVAYVNAARCLGAGRRLLLTDVLLPASLPHVLTGLRIGLGIAWTSVIAAELVGAQSGLGYMIQLNRILLRTDNVVVGMITIGLIGFAMNALTHRLEPYLVPWVGGTLAGGETLAGQPSGTSDP